MTNPPNRIVKITRLSRALAAHDEFPLTSIGRAAAWQELMGACIERGWNGLDRVQTWARETVKREDTT